MTEFRFRFLVVSTLLFLSVTSQECNNDTMKRCRNDVLEALQTNSRSQRSDPDEHCRTVREHFDCLLWQTSMCLDKSAQDANRDTITRTWRYLQSFCESQGSWYTKSCFQREDIKRCEALLPAKGYTADTASCRSYTSFRDCITPIVQIQCSTSDQRLLGTYLMEKGQQRAWNCPRNYDRMFSSDAASAPLAADVDTRYTSLTDTSYGYCADESRSPLQDCRTEFYTAQKEAQTRNDSDMRHHKTCCAMVRYEDCVTRVLQNRCGDRSRSEARTIVSDMKQRFPYYSCDDHSLNECSGASPLFFNITTLLCVILALISMTVAKRV